MVSHTVDCSPVVVSLYMYVQQYTMHLHHTSDRPNVDLVAVALLPQNFRGYVVRSAAQSPERVTITSVKL